MLNARKRSYHFALLRLNFIMPEMHRRVLPYRYSTWKLIRLFIVATSNAISHG